MRDLRFDVGWSNIRYLILALMFSALPGTSFGQWQPTKPAVTVTDGNDYLTLSYKEKRGVKHKWAWIKSEKDGFFESRQYKFENWKPLDSLDAVRNLPDGWTMLDRGTADSTEVEPTGPVVPIEPAVPAEWEIGTMAQRTVDPFENLPWDGNSVAYTTQQKWPIEPGRHSVTLPDVYPVWGVVLQKSAGPFKYDDYWQGKIRAANTSGILQRGDGIYFVKPPGFTEGVTDRYSYLDKFPEFELPEGKIQINDCVFYNDRNRTDFLQKGSSHLPKNTTVPLGQRYVFVGDGWVLGLGMPEAYRQPVSYGGQVYQNRTEAFNQWCRDVNATELLNKFKATFGPLGNVYDIIELNGEGYANDWWVERWKLDACFDWWDQQGFRARFGIWATAPYQLSRVMWQGSPLRIDWGKLPYSERDRGLNAGITNLHWKLGIWEVYAYQNNYQSHNMIHHMLTQYRLNKHYAQQSGRDIRVITTFFAEVDATDNYLRSKQVNRQASDGTKYISETKPEVHPAMMQSMAAWAIATTDGAILWDNYLRFIEQPTDDYGFGWDYEKQRSFWRLLDNEAAYFHQDRRAVDWWMAGVWAVSQNRDIIDDKSTEWVWPKTPDVVAAEEGLLWAYKKSGSDILVLALANWEESGTVSHGIEIDGNTYTIYTDGQWTSVIRLSADGLPTGPTTEGEPSGRVDSKVGTNTPGGHGSLSGLPGYVVSATDRVFNWSGWDRGGVGYTYGSDYFRLAAEVPGGVAYFNFVGQPGVEYPAAREVSGSTGAINGLVQVSLPSHSVTSNWHSVKEYKTISKVRMELVDGAGNIIWQLYDTKGGFHPLDTGLDDKRGNNHPDDCRRWVKPGVYTLRYWNLMDGTEQGVTQQQFEFSKSNVQVQKTGVKAGEYRAFTIDMTDVNASYKLNCNLY